MTTIYYTNIVAYRVVSRQRLGKRAPAATDRHVTIEVLFEMLLSTRSVQRDCKELEGSRSLERT